MDIQGRVPIPPSAAASVPSGEELSVLNQASDSGSPSRATCIPKSWDFADLSVALAPSDQALALANDITLIPLTTGRIGISETAVKDIARFGMIKLAELEDAIQTLDADPSNLRADLTASRLVQTLDLASICHSLNTRVSAIKTMSALASEVLALSPDDCTAIETFRKNYGVSISKLARWVNNLSSETFRQLLPEIGEYDSWVKECRRTAVEESLSQRAEALDSASQSQADKFLTSWFRSGYNPACLDGLISIRTSWAKRSALHSKAPRPLDHWARLNGIDPEVAKIALSVALEARDLFFPFFKELTNLQGPKSEYPSCVRMPSMELAEIDFGAAISSVRSSVEKFSPELAENIDNLYQKRHLHFEGSEAAGSWSYFPAPEVLPYAFIPFSGKPDSVLACAHELGHANQAILASKRSTFYQRPSDVMLETASIFHEMLLAESPTLDATLSKSLLLSRLQRSWRALIRCQAMVELEQELDNFLSEKTDCNREELSAFLNHTWNTKLDLILPTEVRRSMDSPSEWTKFLYIFSQPFSYGTYVLGEMVAGISYARWKSGDTSADEIMHSWSEGGYGDQTQLLSRMIGDPYRTENWQRALEPLREMVRRVSQS